MSDIHDMVAKEVWTILNRKELNLKVERLELRGGGFVDFATVSGKANYIWFEKRITLGAYYGKTRATKKDFNRNLCEKLAAVLASTDENALGCEKMNEYAKEGELDTYAYSDIIEYAREMFSRNYDTAQGLRALKEKLYEIKAAA